MLQKSYHTWEFDSFLYKRWCSMYGSEKNKYLKWAAFFLGTYNISKNSRCLMMTMTIISRIVKVLLTKSINAVDYYIKEKKMDWLNCCELCTDGAKSMLDIFSGFPSHVMKVASNVNWSHCYVHRQSLTFENLSYELKLVLVKPVNMGNFIKNQEFSKLCDEMINLYSTLLFHTELAISV